MQWYLGAFKKYVDFSGRARRTEYWMFTLFNFIVAAVLVILAVATKSAIFYILYALYGLAVLLPGLAVTVRRLHDQDKSGGWFFIGFVPFIGGIWLLVLTCTGGTRGPNRFGPDPKSEIAAPAWPTAPAPN